MLNKWQDFVDMHQNKFGGANHLTVISLGLGGETGEVLDLLKKQVRDGKDIIDELKLELGDVLHYLTSIAHFYGFELEDIMEANIVKLRQRHGDER